MFVSVCSDAQPSCSSGCARWHALSFFPSYRVLMSSRIRHLTAQPASHMRTGRRGEEIAVRYLRAEGYVVLGRNVRFGKDEIDIVAFDPSDRVIVFAEVKARARHDEHYLPELNLTFAKRRKLLRSARAWVGGHRYEGGWRIDAVCVAAGKVVQHLREIACER